MCSRGPLPLRILHYTGQSQRKIIVCVRNQIDRIPDLTRPGREYVEMLADILQENFDAKTATRNSQIFKGSPLLRAALVAFEQFWKVHEETEK
jgi:hypothetical protein